VLESGLTWQIGNDEKVSIWNDKWIPNLPSFTVQSPVSVLQAEARVSELIDHITRWWNFPFIHSVFRPDEANVITSLALSPLLRESRKGQRGMLFGCNCKISVAANLEIPFSPSSKALHLEGMS